MSEREKMIAELLKHDLTKAQRQLAIAMWDAGHKAGLAELARKRDAGWVSVSDRMPVEHGEYWVWLIPHPPQPSSMDRNHSVFLDFEPYARIVKTYDSDKGMRFNCGAVEKPTHWMPYHKPAPPDCAREPKS